MKRRFLFGLHLSEDSTADIRQLALVDVVNIRTKYRAAMILAKKKGNIEMQVDHRVIL